MPCNQLKYGYSRVLSYRGDTATLKERTFMDDIEKSQNIISLLDVDQQEKSTSLEPIWIPATNEIVQLNTSTGSDIENLIIMEENLDRINYQYFIIYLSIKALEEEGSKEQHDINAIKFLNHIKNSLHNLRSESEFEYSEKVKLFDAEMHLNVKDILKDIRKGALEQAKRDFKHFRKGK